MYVLFTQMVQALDEFGTFDLLPCIIDWNSNSNKRDCK